MGWFKKRSEESEDEGFNFEQGVKAFEEDRGTEIIENTAGASFRTKRVTGRTVKLHAPMNPDMMISGGFDFDSKTKAITIMFKQPYDQVMFTLDQIEQIAKQFLDMKKRLDMIDPNEELRKLKERK